MISLVTLMIMSLLSSLCFPMKQLGKRSSVRNGFPLRSARYLSGEHNSPSAFTHEHLPAETMYIFDGTAMLFQAFFSKESKSKEGVYFNKEYLTDLLEQSPSLFRQHEVPNLDAVNCTALYVMLMNFARFIRDVRPQYVACAFDAGRASFRTEALPSYKAQRPATPFELLPQMQAAPELLGLLGVRCFRRGGFEADDLMASLGVWASGKGLHVVHVSIDKDMLQLVGQGVHVMHPFTLQVLGEREVRDKFGVPPSQLCDLLALMGDSVDNIPGAPGIGPKTAQALIQHFLSIDELFVSLGIQGVSLPPSVLKEKRLTKAEVEALLSPAQLQGAVAALAPCLERGGVRLSPVHVLGGLLAVGYDKLRMFREIIRLRRDLDLLDISYPPLSSSSPSLSPTVIGGSDHFRYRGEGKGKGEEVEERLRRVSPLLEQPLSLLRRQYHKIDRL